MKRYVLDASALMTLFDDRPGADKVEELLVQAADNRGLLLMSVVNWGEVYYSIWRARGQSVAEAKIKELSQLPIEVIEVDLATAQLAASLKAEHDLPYAACFAAALALERKATLVTIDQSLAPLRAVVGILFASEHSPT